MVCPVIFFQFYRDSSLMITLNNLKHKVYDIKVKPYSDEDK